MITSANGLWISLPTPRDSAIGVRPRIARRAVIKTARSLATDPDTTAASSDSPARRRASIALITSRAASETWPRSAMNPTAADTDTSTRPARSANPPPVIANGAIASTAAALRADWRAMYRREKTARIDTGTIVASRLMARAWFSNSPPQTK
jgi:hypothetical protein